MTLENILRVISNEIFVKLKILLFHMLFCDLFKESHCYLTIWFVILGVYKTSKKVSWRHFIAVESLILGVLSHILNAPASLRRTKSEVVGGSKKMLPKTHRGLQAGIYFYIMCMCITIVLILSFAIAIRQF